MARTHPLYYVGWALSRLYFWIYHRGRIYNSERLPPKGPCIVAPNHASFLDPPIVGQACNRPIFYVARRTLFDNKFLGWLLPKWNAIPVERGRGDLGAIRAVMELLQRGETVLLFPEGTRSRDGKLQKGQPGIGMLVAKTGATVVPVRVFGAFDAFSRTSKWPRPKKLVVKFGHPIRFDVTERAKQAHGRDAKTLYAGISDEIMQRIAALAPRRD
jgi:1-acyl-sn-glycerol-3-phosphate acyltransferase